MTLKEIFEKVNLTAPIEQRRFFNYFEDSVIELISLYYSYVLIDKTEEFKAPESLDEENPVRPLYTDALVDNILFKAGQGEAYKSEFLRKSRSAWLKYWNDDAKGRRLKPKIW